MIARFKDNKNGIIFVLSAMVILLLACVVNATPRLIERNKQEIRMTEQTELADVLQVRWENNGYAPAADEIMAWLSWINAKDIRGRGLVFWSGFTDRESLGSPMNRPKVDSGMTRGLTSIKRVRLEDYCWRNKREMPERADVSLYNPLFNLKIAMDEIEFLVDKYEMTKFDEAYAPIKDGHDFPLAWALLDWNSGAGVADRLGRRGIRPRFTFYKAVMERVEEIESEVINRKGGER